MLLIGHSTEQPRGLTRCVLLSRRCLVRHEVPEGWAERGQSLSELPKVALSGGLRAGVSVDRAGRGVEPRSPDVVARWGLHTATIGHPHAGTVALGCEPRHFR
ncbi:hypothetical protein [Devosia sp. DBB001]|nr:hypothetical protein [Devosia sp. DBB001]